MSWSVNAIGRAAAVAKKIEESLANVRCVEPEESAKAAVGGAIQTLLQAYPSNFVVRVEASGSQTNNYEGDGIVNTLNVRVEPVYGFVE